ncbi:hypothetical protein [Pseudoalteromonas luteoviolacea]|uniref:DUF1579 domain-containing protein n=1 Tax=Pseudoalteromonas luteoviolacea DSM 6061 TaxID=1365250 RepID=A0A166VMK7_9GAMM|nr:hypothetical protein [Pseudoalteromonas luteoviolacea]KZN33187.1 hypothetical protein N475_03610 [Pseudoalteromonas luteoviolacea DSM 6061]
MRTFWLVISMISMQLQASPCSSQEYKSFDFWLGDWKVKSNEKYVATSKISKILDGCVILEEYQTTSGFAGKSLNTYSTESGIWHQTWMDNKGGMLILKGGIEGQKMILRGVTLEKDGTEKKHEITWQKQQGGTVHQVWRARADNNDWVILFSGLYLRN